MSDMGKGILAAANSPFRAVLTTVIGGVTLGLVLWMASLLSHVSHALPALERRVSAIEARDNAVIEQAAATREALAVVRTQIAGVQEEMRLLRSYLIRQDQRRDAQ